MRIVKELVEIWPNEVCNSLSSRSGVEIEIFSYIHPPFKVATSRSNELGMKNVVELRVSDMSRSSRVFAMELRCEFWCRDFGSGLPGIVFVAISLLLNEVLESSPVPTTVEYFLYFPLRFSVDDYGRWVVLRFASRNRVVWSRSELHCVEHWMELLHPVLRCTKV